MSSDAVNIYLSQDHPDGVSAVQNWLHFHDIPYADRALWCNTSSRYVLPNDIENSILVCDFKVFLQCVDQPDLGQNQFFMRNNQLWITGTDITLQFTRPHTAMQIRSLDSAIQKNKIVLFLDAEMLPGCYLHNLVNISTIIHKTNFFNRRSPRYQASSTSKISCTHDFLLTMVRKANRPHRDILWHELEQRPKLCERGKIHCRTKENKLPWIGQTKHLHDYGHASMDLYLDCWLELVPETCHDDLMFFTEKTRKPMLTGTPFLMVTTPGYLDFLHRSGFRTFDSLIDESYDTQLCLEKRVTAVLDVLTDITQNGAQQFYQASKPILEHNFNRLCEISGSWWRDFDQDMWHALEKFENRK